MKKPWSGRFKEETSKVVESFTESISFDKRLWRHDIMGSIAHTKMLSKQGIISPSEAKTIISGLNKIAEEIKSNTFQFKKELEDIHMNIETALIEKVGDIGGKLHTARSRNDQIALDTRLYLREESKNIINIIKKLLKVLLKIAEKNFDKIMPGYTHLQRAQPVILSHHILAYAEMFLRDKERLEDAYKRIDTMPLGSCALSGTTLPIDRSYVAKLLGFKRISENSMDAVSDRDFAIEFVSISSILMMHLSRLAEELVLWSTEEFSFIEIPDAYTTGSSIMPQKKNPDVVELIRGKTGRVYGSLMNILTLMKALPLTYNRDMQEDKISIFDTVDTIKASLTVFTEMISGIKFDTERLYNTADEGYSLATDIADYLVKKGIPFREAHRITGTIIKYSIKKNKKLNELSIDELKKFSNLIDNEIYEYISLESAIIKRQIRGGTSQKEIKKQITRLKKLLK